MITVFFAFAADGQFSTSNTNGNLLIREAHLLSFKQQLALQLLLDVHLLLNIKRFQVSVAVDNVAHLDQEPFVDLRQLVEAVD